MPESHEIVLPATVQLREFFQSPSFEPEVRQTLKSSYEVDLQVRQDRGLEHLKLSTEESEIVEERLLLQFTRNNVGGLKDAIDFLVSRLIPHGLDASTVKGAIPRPKSDSFEDSLPFFDSKLLHTPNGPHTPLGTDSPTRSTFGASVDDVSERGSLFGKIRKPGSISSISSFLDRRKNNASHSPGASSSFFKQASSNASRASLVSMESRANASRASLVSMESRDSGYRNPWNDSGVNLPEEDEAPFTATNGGGAAHHPWGYRFENKSENKLPLFAGSKVVGPSTVAVGGVGPMVGVANSVGTYPGDMTPRYDPRASHDSGRPSTSHSTNGYPVPIGPPR